LGNSWVWGALSDHEEKRGGWSLWGGKKEKNTGKNRGVFEAAIDAIEEELENVVTANSRCGSAGGESST